MPIILLSILLAFLFILEKSNEISNIQSVHKVATSDFKSEINIIEISRAIDLCRSKINIDSCDGVYWKAQQVSNAVLSCADHPSTLCKTITDEAAQAKEILDNFPIGRLVKIPTDPFYLTIGNEFLDAHASNFNFRQEMLAIWRAQNQVFYRLVFSFLFSISLTSVFTWVWRQHKQSQKRKQQELLAMEAERQADEQAHIREEENRRASEAAMQRMAAEAAAIEAESNSAVVDPGPADEPVEATPLKNDEIEKNQIANIMTLALQNIQKK